MYGLINSALKDMIMERFGDEKWQQVLNSSGVPEDSFLTMRSYDDALTFALAGAASDVLEAPLDTCLEMFGEYWVLETATRSYPTLMDASGGSLVDFLQNLNALHDRITSTFVDYVPPSFQIENLEQGRYRVHYESQREGLNAFVVGLLRGLAQRFNTDLQILSQHAEVVPVGTHTVFEVEISPQ